MTMIEFESAARKWAALVSIVAASGCGAQTDEREALSSETHFLSRCSDDCPDGLSCIDGACTRACSSDDACADLNSNAECLPGSGDGNSCQVVCAGTPECRAENDEWTCQAARCAEAVAGPDPVAACPAFAGGVQEPVQIEANAESIPGSLDVHRAAADATGVYWIDRSHAVFGRPRGGDTESLRAAPGDEPGIVPGTLVVTGLVSDETTVYFADGIGPDPNGPPSADPPRPPGRLWAVPKSGGEAVLLHSSDSLVLYPLGVVNERLILTDHNQVYAFDVNGEAAPYALDHIPASDYVGFHLGGDQVFWRSTVDERGVVMAVDLSGGDPVEVVDLGSAEVSSEVLANGRVLLYAPEMLVTEPLNLVQYFEMVDLDSGCHTQLPSVGTSIGSAIVDDTHVYWKSFNGLGGVSPGDDLDAPVPYLRVNLETGALEEVTSPDFHASLIRDILAQDDEAIYFKLNDDGSLVALQKPD